MNILNALNVQLPQLNLHTKWTMMMMILGTFEVYSKSGWKHSLVWLRAKMDKMTPEMTKTKCM